jgi:methylenetetrahydrofolate reductase (NADPH)
LTVSATASARSLEPPRFEIVPIRSVDRQLELLPAGATVTVTSSPRFGITRTLEYTERLVAAGYAAVPHLAARQVQSAVHLAEIVDAFSALGVRELFVIAGDDPEVEGPYAASYALLLELASLKQSIDRIGIACYPEGHPLIDEQSLMIELLRKQDLADYMVSQMCFDPSVTRSWIRRARRTGVTLPLYVGIPGVVRPARLLELSFRLGVGSSLRFLSKHDGFGGRLFRRGLFRPDTFIDGLRPALDEPDLGVAGYHFFTFNEVAHLVRWIDRHVEGNTSAEGSAS